VYAIASQFVNFQSQQDFGRITGSKHMFLGLNGRAILSSSQYYSGSGDWGWVVWWRCFLPFALPKDCKIEIRELKILRAPISLTGFGVCVSSVQGRDFRFCFKKISSLKSRSELQFSLFWHFFWQGLNFEP
jgi:hypothetical protein